MSVRGTYAQSKFTASLEQMMVTLPNDTIHGQYGFEGHWGTECSDSHSIQLQALSILSQSGPE